LDAEIIKGCQKVISFKTYTNPEPIQEEIEQIDPMAVSVDPSLILKKHNVNVLESFAKNYSDFAENLNKVEGFIEQFKQLSEHVDELVKKEDLEKLFIAHLLLINENITEIKSDIKGINESDIQAIHSIIQDIEQKTENLNESFDLEIPRLKKSIFENTHNSNLKIEELTTGVESFNKDVADLQEKLHEEQELRQTISEELTSTVEVFTKDFDDIRERVSEENLFRQKLSEELTDLDDSVTTINGELSALAEQYETAITPTVEKINLFEQKIKSVEDTIVSYSDDFEQAKQSLYQVVNEVNQIFINDKYSELNEKVEQIQLMFSSLQEKETLVENMAATASREELLKVLKDKSFQQPNPDEVNANFKAVTTKLKFLEQAIGRIAAAGPGGGEVNLRYLDDVDRSTIGDNKYLRYNATTKKFEFAEVTGGGGSAVGSIRYDISQSLTSDDKNQAQSNMGLAAVASSGSYADLTNTPVLIKAAVPWSANHTIADGTRYLIGDVVYDNGNIFVANFENESIPTSSTLYWTNLGPGNRLNIDGRDIQNISYTQLTNKPFIPTIPDQTGNTGKYLTTDGSALSWSTVTNGVTDYNNLTNRPDLSVYYLATNPNGYITEVVTISDSAPTSPSGGDLWWNSTEGTLKIYYSDADSSQWVDTISNGIKGDTGLQGPRGEIGPKGDKGDTGDIGPIAEGSVRYDISQTLTSANKTQAQTNMGLANVASSGSYTDLTNKPVLFSGSYTDLTNKPTIPAAQIQSDWTQTSNTALDYIKNKPVLFSGNYTDLTNKPVLFDGAYANLTGKPNLSVYYLATNPSGYITGITSSNVITALGFTPYNATNPNGYISVITSSNVTTALGFTPYNATNPSGYITTSALTGYALSSSLSTVATSGSYADLTNKPTLFSGSFADLTSKPTTLSGYGITNAQATLVSGTNIKTINGTSVLGSGNIVISGAGASPATPTVYGTVYGITDSTRTALGSGAGQSQSCFAVAVGSGAGLSQGCYSVAVGGNAGATSQGCYSVAVGGNAGVTSQSCFAIAIGRNAGNSTQGGASVAIGACAGFQSQGSDAVSIGSRAGTTSQSCFAVAVGSGAGYSGQGDNAIAIGKCSGYLNQAACSIAIGKCVAAPASGLYVSPIRDQSVAGGTPVGLGYCVTSKEIVYGVSGETTSTIVTKLSTATAISDVSGNLRSIPQNARTSAYVLVATDNGKHISITTGGVTVPASVFAAGDSVMIVNNSAASQTITQGSGLTLRWAGQATATTGNRTIGLYSIATVLFISPTVAFISGAGVA